MKAVLGAKMVLWLQFGDCELDLVDCWAVTKLKMDAMLNWP